MENLLKSPPLSPSSSIKRIYQPLDSSRHQLRCLSLSPGEFNDPIDAALDIVSLDDDPKYEALSYVWGQDSSPTSMVVRGTDISITQNLDIALRHIRHRYLRRSLWVDAICIDQHNKGEREDQVKFMRRIYQSALRVLIWLGPSADDSDIAMRSIQNSDEQSWETYDFAVRFMEILYRPWFTRIWVVQEFILGKNPRIGCGTFWVHWVSFMKAWARCGMDGGAIKTEYQKHFHEAVVGTFQSSWIKDMAQKTSASELGSESDIVTGLQSALGGNYLQYVGFASMHELLCDIEDKPALWSARHAVMRYHQRESPTAKAYWRKLELIRLVPFNYYAFLWLCRDATLNGNWPSFTTILKGTMNLRSTDPRDRIYGILGLVGEEAHKHIPVDYEKSPEWTLVPTMEYAIKYEPGGLALLDFFWRTRPFKIPFPSWVADFTVSVNVTDKHCPALLCGSCLNASWKWPQDAEVSKDHTTLSASGLSFGKVKELVHFMNGDLQTYLNQFRDLESLVTRECPLNEPLWRTLIGFYNSGPMDSEMPLCQRFEVLMGRSDSQMQSIASVALSREMFYDNILRIVNGRTFFVTDLGFAGIATPEIQKGDTIGFIFGMERAAVLRSVVPDELGVNTDVVNKGVGFHRITAFGYVGCHNRQEFGQLENDGLTDWTQHFCFRNKEIVKFYIV